MGIVSYAQNREDVRLARVFTEPVGFYIDVGASDPTFHSITRHFSDRGWRGINVEPRAAGAEALRAARPRDVTVQAVIGRSNGEAEFFELARPELGEVSTAVSARAEALAAMGHRLESRRVPMLTLARLCEEHRVTAIDFLSIDTEGAEADVIAGNDWTRFRPRVVLVEVFDITTLAPTDRPWEPALIEAGYVFAADDGINRFYVAREASQALLEPLSRPISCIDLYEPYEFRQEIERVRAEARATMAEAGGSVSLQVLAEAQRAQGEGAWAAYQGLRDELARLRHALEAHERHLAEGELAGGVSMGTFGRYEGVGPLWLALAARATRLSRRYPGLSTKIKSQAIGLRQRVRRLRG